jgi:hypothetical protein
MRIFNLLALAMVMVSVISCSKSVPPEYQAANSGTSFKDTAQGIPAAHFLSVSGDNDQTRSNEALYDIARASRDYVVNNTGGFLSILYTEAFQNSSKEIDLYHLLDDYASIKEAFRKRLAILTGNDTLTFNFATWTETNLAYDTIYTPAIYIPNRDNMDTTKTPIIAIGAELDGGIYSWAYDHILAWSYVNGNFEGFAMNESFAMNTDHPVLIFSGKVPCSGCELFPVDLIVDKEYDGNGGGSGPGGGSGDCPQNGIPVYKSVKFKINFAYERGKWSNYQLILVDHRGATPVAAEWRVDVDNAQHLDTWITYNKVLFVYSSLLTASNVDISNQERDWYASLKPLGNVHVQQSTTSVFHYSGRRKFFHEFYNLADFVPGFDWLTYLPCDGRTYIHSNFKGSNEFRRDDQ